MIKLTIQGIPVEVKEGSTVLDAARMAGIRIPTLCYHPDLKPFASCGLCVCKQEGSAKILRACSTPAAEGMKIIANDEELFNVRRSVLQLILSTHPASCLTCIKNNKCELQSLASEFGLREQPFPERIQHKDKDRSTGALVLDSEKCIKCGRCIEVCHDLQGVYALEFTSRGDKVQMSPAFNLPLNESPCIKCGQCAAHCPVGAIYEEDETDRLLKALNDPDVVTMVQIAPAVRVAIGEEFGLKPGEVSTGKLYSALRRLGADYIFDTNFGADLTIMEEGSELIDRIKNGGVLPQITSCCPGWINYAEEYYPDLLDNLSSAKSPMMMQGAIEKTYSAKKLNVAPDKIFSVAIMPCIAKKTEINRDGVHAESSGYRDVDLVLTTRELARLIKAYGIDFENLEESQADSPVGAYSGAATIFGVTGGVMEAAVRTANFVLSGKELENPKIELVRGLDDVKSGTVMCGDVTLKVAIVHGMANAKKLLEQIRKDKRDGKKNEYDFIEIMACRGGCIAGGGQPYGTDDEMREKRIKGLYTDDEKSVVRCSHQNEEIKTLYKDFLEKPLSHKSHELLHTVYKQIPLYKD